MATREQLEEAIRRADKAGDADSVRKLGTALRAMTPAPAKSPSVGQQLWNGTVNKVAGITQGVGSLADLAATAAGKIMSAPATLGAMVAEGTGHPDAARTMRSTASQLANPPTIGRTIENVAPTPNTTLGKVDRFAAQMFGSALPLGAVTNPSVALEAMGIIPKVPPGYHPPTRPGRTLPRAREVVETGKKAGVRVLTSDVRPPRTFVGKSVQALGERIPITGTGGPRQAQQVERIAAIKDLARDYGAAVGDEATSPAIDDVVRDLAAKRGGELKQLTGIKTAVINKFPDSVPVSRTIAAIDGQIGELEKVGTAAANAVIGKLQNWRQAIYVAPQEVQTGILDASATPITRTVIPESKNLATIELIRKEMGEAFADPNLASIRSTGEKALSRIYGPMREDMGAFIKSKSATDFSQWKLANDRLAAMAGDLKINSLKRVLTTAEATPENVATMLFSNKPSDVRRLYSGLTPMGRTRAQAAIMQRAVEKAGGIENVSPERFSSQIKALGNQTGIFFEGDDLARVEGLNRLLMATKRAGEAAAHPTTGAQATPYVIGSLMTGLFGLPGGVAATGGTGLLARAYESAPVRNMLLALGKTKPGSAGERAVMDRAARSIAAVVAANSTRGATGINDNLPQIGALVASPEQRPDNTQ